MTESAPRPLELVAGGTSPQQVHALRAALATRLRPHTRPHAPAPSPEPGPAPLLVPLSPTEDAATVRAWLGERLRGAAVPPQAELLLRTSGSTTGSAKLVAMSVPALIASAQATHKRLAGPGTWVLALPCHHVAGLQVLVRSLLAGSEPVVVDTSAGFSAQALAQGVGEALEAAGGGPVYVSLVPTQLVDLLDRADARAVLARTAAVLVGGAALSHTQLTQARAAGLPVVTTYGMTETGGGCVYDGLPLEGVNVRIDSPDSQGTGRVVLSGAVLAQGYIAKGAASSSSFRAGPEGALELVTSDLGRLERGLDGSERLVVLGRADDVIITGGVKVSPQEVEAVLVALPGVAQACVVALPHARWGRAVTAVVVPQAGQDSGQAWCEHLRAQARERLDGAHTPKQVLAASALPTRGPGKVDRQAVAGLAADLAAQSQAPGALR